MKSVTGKKTFYSMDDHDEAGGTRYFLRQSGFIQVPNLDAADIIVFNGGADIGTSIYGETPVMERIPLSPSERDRHEMNVYNKYQGRKFLFGICRGAQLLNCLNGGSLWQHVNHHDGSHSMWDLDEGKEYRVTSTHHQMMRPNLKKGRVIGVSSRSTIKFAAGEGRVDFDPNVKLDDGKDVEIVWYPESHSLCMQGHPEYVPGSIFGDYAIDLITKHFNEVNLVKA